MAKAKRKSKFKNLVPLLILAGIAIFITVLILAQPTKFYYTERDDGTYDLEIRSVNRLSKTVTVPAEYNGTKVTSFLVDAYDADTTFEKVTAIILEDGIEEIDLKLLDCCPNLETLELPASIKRVEGTISDRINITIAEGSGVELKSGCFIDKKTMTVMASQHYAEIPEGVKVIGSHAFFNSKLKTIKIPASVERIESSAFSGVELDESIELNLTPNLKYIGGAAFWAHITIDKLTVSTSTLLPSNLFGDSKQGGATIKCIVLDVYPNIVTDVDDDEPIESAFKISAANNGNGVLRYIYIKKGVSGMNGPNMFEEVKCELEGYSKFDYTKYVNKDGFSIVYYVSSTSDR